MITRVTKNSPAKGEASRRAFTLAEVVVAVGISALVYMGIILAYVQSSQRAEWSGYSLAAQALSIKQSEQARAGKWDTMAATPVDQLTTNSFPGVTWTNLDIPISGTNVVRATNFTSLSTLYISTNPSVMVKMIRVDTVWLFRGRPFTNTTVTYRSPNINYSE